MLLFSQITHRCTQQALCDPIGQKIQFSNVSSATRGCFSNVTSLFQSIQMISPKTFLFLHIHDIFTLTAFRLQLIGALLERYPTCIPEDEYTLLLQALQQLQAETKKVTGINCNIVTNLFDF